MDRSEQKYLVTEVKHVLSRNGFYCVWSQQGGGDKKRFLSELKQKLLDNFIQEWDATIRDKDGYFPYRNVKFIFELERYLSVLEMYCFRVGLCQLRLGVLPISTNFHRYSVLARNRNYELYVN